MAIREFEKVRDEEIPSLSEIKAAFARLDALITSNAPLTTIAQCITHIPLSRTQVIRLNMQPPERVYRARRLAWNEDATQPATFGYPPSSNASLGRANLAGIPVFYCALGIDTAIKEYLHVQHAEESCLEIYVSQWKVKRDFNAKQFLHASDFLKDERLKTINTDAVAKFRGMIAEYSQDKQEALMYSAEKMGAYFLSHRHEISALIADSAFEDFRKGPVQINALIYPSVVKDHRDVSLAFDSKFVDEHLELAEVRRLRLGRLDHEGSNAKWLSLGLPKDERIEWFSPLFGPSYVRRHSVQMNGVPEETLQYKSETVTIGEHEMRIEDLAAKIYTTSQADILQQLLNEVSNVPFNPEPRHSVFNFWIQDPTKYEGVKLDKMRIALTLEHRVGLEPDTM